MNRNGKSGKSYGGINSVDVPTDAGRGFFSEESGSDNIVNFGGQDEDEMAELDFGHSNF